MNNPNEKGRSAEAAPVPNIQTLKEDIDGILSRFGASGARDQIPSQVFQARHMKGSRTNVSASQLESSWVTYLKDKRKWLKNKRFSESDNLSERDIATVRTVRMRTDLFLTVLSEDGHLARAQQALTPQDTHLTSLPDYTSHSGIGQRVEEVNGVRKRVWSDLFKADFDSAKDSRAEQLKMQKQHALDLVHDISEVQGQVAPAFARMRNTFKVALPSAPGQALEIFLTALNADSQQAQSTTLALFGFFTKSASTLEIQADTISFDDWKKSYTLVVGEFRVFYEMLESHLVALNLALADIARIAKAQRAPTASVSPESSAFEKKRKRAEQGFQDDLKTYVRDVLIGMCDDGAWPREIEQGAKNRASGFIIGRAPEYVSIVATYYESVGAAIGPGAEAFVAELSEKAPEYAQAA
jgi:hypothetical protein